MKMPTLLILFALIQVSIAPEYSPEGKIIGMSKEELQALLREPGNAEKVKEIMNLMQNNSEKEAEERMKELKQKQISRELIWVLRQLIKTPQITYDFLLRPVLLALHKKLEEESTTYKTFAGPVRNFIEGTGYVLLRFLGLSIQSSAELAQIINNIVKDGNTAWHNGEVRNEKTHNTINKAAETLKKFGNTLDNDGSNGLRGIFWRRKQQQEKNELLKKAATSFNQAGGK